MKKTIIVLISLILALSFASCDVILGGDNNSEGELPPNSQGGENKPSGDDENTNDPTEKPGENTSGEGSGSNTEGGNTEGDKPGENKPDEGLITDPDELKGLSVLGASLSGKGEISLSLTGGKSVILGNLSKKDDNTLNISYNQAVYSALGITGFEALGADGLTVIVGSTRFDCVGKLLCEHDLVDHPRTEPSCDKVGNEAYKTCTKCDYTTYKELPKTLHSIVEDKGYPPTETEYGLSDGSHCSQCLEIIVAQYKLLPTGFGGLDSYAGRYGYEYLGTMQKGSALQSFYNLLDKTADAFHVSDIDLEDNRIAEVNFESFGLTTSEALAVYTTYKNDNPLYYWLGSSVSYTDKALYLQTDEEYRLSSVRNSFNDLIYSKVKEYFELSRGYESIYYLTLVLHDGIISGMDYAYESDGITPKNDSYAHNVLGALVLGEGVCESYARAFQLILNYSGVDNIFVSGLSRGEAHAWNLVKLDDGEYYWYDLTWDDTPDYMQGISYNYFATDDDSILTWRDYGWKVTEPGSFLSTHTPTLPTLTGSAESGLSFLYGIPERAGKSIPLSDLRISFTVGNIEYTRTGMNTVQVSALPSGAVTVPEKVSYQGREYIVIGLGSAAENGLFGTDSIGNNVTSLSLPKTVKYIADKALEIETLASITVDADSPYFTAVDGVLFTKNLVTLVKYPQAKSESSYRIPDATLYVAYGAMYYLKNVNLIEVGPNLKCFGYTYMGYAFTDSPDGKAVNQIVNIELQNIYNTMKYGGRIEVDENNPNFTVG